MKYGLCVLLSSAAGCGIALAQPTLVMTEGFEDFSPGLVGAFGVETEADDFQGPPGFEWGTNVLRMQPTLSYGGVRDLSGSPVDGNGTNVLFVRTDIGQSPGGLFTGFELTWNESVRPHLDTPARVETEFFTHTLHEGTTFEPINYRINQRFRARWGAVWCDGAGPCEFEYQPALMPGVLYMPGGMNPTPGGAPLQVGGRWCLDVEGQPIAGCVPPTGETAGDLATLPASSWFRVAYEVRNDGRFTMTLDRLDGRGEAAVGAGDASFVAINRLASNSAFRVLGAETLIDNVVVSGVERVTCGTDINFDGVTDFTD
ncbi:MAG: hypothetical protein ACTS27_11000, partial [Phycisphaerales bacterium]